MLYEYPDEFIVPITYINTSDCRTGKQEIKDDKNIKETEKSIKSLAKGEKRKINISEEIYKRNRLEKTFRNNENSRDMLDDLINENLISGNQKDYYLKDVDMYSDIDDEYVKDQTKKK